MRLISVMHRTGYTNFPSKNYPGKPLYNCFYFLHVILYIFFNFPEILHLAQTLHIVFYTVLCFYTTESILSLLYRDIRNPLCHSLYCLWFTVYSTFNTGKWYLFTAFHLQLTSLHVVPGQITLLNIF